VEAAALVAADRQAGVGKPEEVGTGQVVDKEELKAVELEQWEREV
jgi:hypothetical protein